MKILVSQVRFILNTCLTVMKIVVHSGASRKEHQKKERHTMKQTMNSTAKNDIQLYNLLKKTIFPFQTDNFFKESLHMFDTQKNELMNNVIAYDPPKTRLWRIA